MTMTFRAFNGDDDGSDDGDADDLDWVIDWLHLSSLPDALHTPWKLCNAWLEFHLMLLNLLDLKLPHIASRPSAIPVDLI